MSVVVNTEVLLRIDRTASFADGYAFGDAGAYERVTGEVSFALDPEGTSNQSIVDLALAPRNERGLVEFRADLDILKPVDLSRGNQRLLYDVNNRGSRTALRAFNDAPADNDPTTLTAAGNGYLMREGYTVVWSGWQGDLLAGDGLLIAALPEASENGTRLCGTVRQEFIAEEKGVLSLPLSGAPNIRSYEALDLDTTRATLTKREHELDARQPLAPGAWAFAVAKREEGTGAVRVSPSPSSCYVKDGFAPGWIYELIYETEGSRVMGLGLAGIRDLMSFLRYEDGHAAGAPNPLAGHADRAYVYGQSLCARVIRQFIYDGFNLDPAGRRVFDAAYPHVSGGGRLFANARFAQVGRYPRQHEEHQWPSERYPFAYSAVPDPFSEDLDSVLKRPDSDPLVMHTHTNTEYWNRHGSLGHTDPRDGGDLEVPDGVRMYGLASAQHAGANVQPGEVGQHLSNGMNNGPFLRAVLSLMNAWATDGTPPPASRVGRRADDTLVTAAEALKRFPVIPGFDVPAAPSRLPKYDYGPDFDRGMVTEHPPKPVPGQEYPVLVPQVDVDGNDIAGLRSPEVTAPVGTHTGWNPRKDGAAGGDLASLSGSFVPFARTKVEREATGDPRLSIEERYGTHAGYVSAIVRAAESLVSEGLLLTEDADRYVDAANERDPLDPDVPLLPLTLSKSIPEVL